MAEQREKLEQVARSLGFISAALPDTVVSPDSAIRFLVEALATGGSLAAESVAEAARAVLAREFLGSTALGGGIAIPHGVHEAVKGVAGVTCWSENGINWETPDRRPVHWICLMIAGPNSPGDHLRALRRMSAAARGLS